MQYFIRYTKNEEQAHEDMERGYSFHKHALHDMPRFVVEMAFGFDPKVQQMEREEIVARYGLKPTTGRAAGMWGVGLNGLCGFGPYASVEEAEAAVNTPETNYRRESLPVAAIFFGNLVADERVQDGICFEPMALVKTAQR